jgi:hypothetical protein
MYKRKEGRKIEKDEGRGRKDEKTKERRKERSQEGGDGCQRTTTRTRAYCVPTPPVSYHLSTPFHAQP